MAAFYSVWLNYTTVKDFAWADKYNPAAAPNRKVHHPLCIACRCKCCILCFDVQVIPATCILFRAAAQHGGLDHKSAENCKARLNCAWQHPTCHAKELPCLLGVGIGIRNSGNVCLLAKANISETAVRNHDDISHPFCWQQVRRLMEEDNKKERKSMKRVHNDAVRELVAFVRKRDKRLAAHQAEEAKRRMEKEEQDKLR